MYAYIIINKVREYEPPDDMGHFLNSQMVQQRLPSIVYILLYGR